jgi:hypothetical protein
VRGGGRAVVGTPASMTSSPAFAEVLAILREGIPDLGFDGDLPLAEPAELRREMSVSGFADVDVRTITRSFTFRSLAAIWSIASRAAAPIVFAREAMGEERWSDASEEVARRLAQRFGAGPHQIDLTVNLASARK